MGFDGLEVFHHPLLERILAGIRRLRGEANTRERRPITRDLLLQMLRQFDKNTRFGATMHASFCLAFAGFLRIGEFTWTSSDLLDEDFEKWFLTRRSVSFRDDHLLLTLPSSKADPFRRGITLTIAATNDEACAVASLKHLFDKYPAELSSPLFNPHRPFTRKLVTDTMRDTLLILGHGGHYAGHSFRRGAATSAREAGLTDAEIQLLGRWKSDSYRLYIVTHPARILDASRRHQQALFLRPRG